VTSELWFQPRLTALVCPSGSRPSVSVRDFFFINFIINIMLLHRRGHLLLYLRLLKRWNSIIQRSAIVLMLLLLHRGKRRRSWVHDINLRRPQQGDFGNLLHELQSDENISYLFQGIHHIAKSLSPFVRQLFAQNFFYSANDSECSRVLFARTFTLTSV